MKGWFLVEYLKIYIIISLIYDPLKQLQRDSDFAESLFIFKRG